MALHEGPCHHAASIRRFKSALKFPLLKLQEVSSSRWRHKAISIAYHSTLHIWVQNAKSHDYVERSVPGQFCENIFISIYKSLQFRCGINMILTNCMSFEVLVSSLYRALKLNNLSDDARTRTHCVLFLDRSHRRSSYLIPEAAQYNPLSILE